VLFRSMPSGTSLAVDLLLNLAELQHEPDYRRRAVFTLESLAEPMLKFPTSFGHLLGCADMELNGAVEVALVGDIKTEGMRALERAVASQYVPSLVLAAGDQRSTQVVKLLEGRTMIDRQPTAYVCRGYVCDRPVTEPAALAEQLTNAARMRATATA